VAGATGDAVGQLDPEVEGAGLGGDAGEQAVLLHRQPRRQRARDEGVVVGLAALFALELELVGGADLSVLQGDLRVEVECRRGRREDEAGGDGGEGQDGEL
jgi:hypothetical protein